MIGTPVRGVAYANGRLFCGTMDGHVLSLDAKTGDLLWDIASVDPKAGVYYTAVGVRAFSQMAVATGLWPVCVAC